MSLQDHQPPFPKDQWPKIDILVCHYSEPSEETIANVRKCLELEYPPSKLRIVICDDGYLKSDFGNVGAVAAAGVDAPALAAATKAEAKDGLDPKKPEFWPRAKENAGLIKQTGDTRAMLRALARELATQV